MTSIDPQKLLGRIRELGGIGRDGEGGLVRLAASDADRLGRDRFVGWLREAGLETYRGCRACRRRQHPA